MWDASKNVDSLKLNKTNKETNIRLAYHEGTYFYFYFLVE